MKRMLVQIGAMLLTPSPSVLKLLPQKRIRHPYLPDPSAILLDLQQLNLRGGVPAVLVMDKKKNVEKLQLYTSTYYITLYETNHNDGYRIGQIDAMKLQEHERLAKGALMIQSSSGWYMYPEVVDFPRGYSNSFGPLQEAWKQLQQQPGGVAEPTAEIMTPAQESYLNNLAVLIEVTRQLERDKQAVMTSIPYRRVEAAGEERIVRDIYIFHLVGNPQISEKEMLRVQGSPDLQGRMISRKGNAVTIKFEGPIDLLRISKQGNLERVVNDTVYRKQLKAVDMIRDGEHRNRYLLSMLVNHLYQPYRAASVSPQEPLNRKQYEAFQRALTVPDTLLVLGPPGTGKTRTITEVVRRCAQEKKRVLITSRTHKAVDNVLERLERELAVVRFGHEDRIAESIRPRMIDAQARELQKNIMSKTETQAPQFNRLVDQFMNINVWIQRLGEKLGQLRTIEQHLQGVSQRQHWIEQRITQSFKPHMDELSGSLQQQRQQLSDFQEKMQRWQGRQQRSEQHSDIPLVGAIYSLVARFSERRASEVREQLNEANQLHAQTEQQYQRENQRFLYQKSNDPDMLQCQMELHRLQRSYQAGRDEARQYTSILSQSVRGLVPSQPSLEPPELSTFQRYYQWFQQTYPILIERGKLLKEWRTGLEERSDQLYPELLRYADVVGTTCIGAATARGLEHLEFDLVIVDEAGQICLPDLLVPLVRAKRAMLVGDYNQLPPFVDNEVQTWLDGLSPQKFQALGLSDEEADVDWIANLLTTSAFEQLFKSAPPEHIVYFNEQRRTPEVIANFVSKHFYGHQLATAGADKVRQAPHHDILFRSPLVFVDTAELPERKRRDSTPGSSRGGTDPEGWGKSGYKNDVEAELIADLVAAYHREQSEWVVIVPYQAQARLVSSLVRKRIEVTDFRLEDRISTVDAFQGGERDVVIFGFTRSNSRGNIGFLKELRRLNVAMTRAKQQLILIGDSSTLTQAHDAAFRTLLRDLHDYAGREGQRISYEQCRYLLTSTTTGSQIS